MKYSILSFCILLAACGGDENASSAVPPPPAQNASADNFAAAAASSPLATEILNSAQEQDILSSSRQAMREVSASEIALFEDTASDIFVHNTGTSAPVPPMNAVCEHYFQRVERCFAQTDAEQGGAVLLEMTRQAQAEIAAEQPDETACSALNRSFDAVARNLGCH